MHILIGMDHVPLDEPVLETFWVSGLVTVSTPIRNVSIPIALSVMVST